MGYKTILGMGDIPGVDGELRVESAGGGLERVFRRLQAQQQVQEQGREMKTAREGGGKREGNREEKGDGKKKKGWILIRAAYEANKWPFWSAVVPRLALLGFSLCQPFLIEAVVGYLASRERKEGDEEGETGSPQPVYYGRALVGGFVLLYVGIAVSGIIAAVIPGWVDILTIVMGVGFKGDILATDEPNDCSNSVGAYCYGVSAYHCSLGR